MSCSLLIFLVQGRQARRELDELKNQAQQDISVDPLPDSRVDLLDRKSAKSVKRFWAATSTDSFQTSNSFHARNLAGIAV